MFLNEMDIEDAKRRCESDNNLPIQAKMAARFLSDFCDLINSISDGWCYWHYGTKCSKDLQDLVDQIQHSRSLHPTPQHCYKACAKVENFLKRCKQTKNNPDVQLFLQEHKNKP